VIFRVILRLLGVISRLGRTLDGCDGGRGNLWGVLRDRRKRDRVVRDAPVGFRRQFGELGCGLHLSFENCDIDELVSSSRCYGDKTNCNRRRDA
jgi:hypothetical protein